MVAFHFVTPVGESAIIPFRYVVTVIVQIKLNDLHLHFSYDGSV
jgi:hypothetical protein